MKHAFLGLFGGLFGAVVLLPAHLMSKTFSGAEAVGPSPTILAIQMTGGLIMVGAPLLYWVILPVLKRNQKKKHQV